MSDMPETVGAVLLAVVLLVSSLLAIGAAGYYTQDFRTPAAMTYDAREQLKRQMGCRSAVRYESCVTWSSSRQ